ncbi:ArnT family glycosyltransferase [Streptomyces sp. ME19-01-6]|uniref:ArnT family glycosyltransferase n=1 Tax=Streptomyces sp. ME19-01-6 TaxID=3028686 RepID=UPI0029A77282|nr:glycosyltransferase family 39 protein [Streptomyces sp. ME19-01-6]MDX3228304.1 glycosyltransferase family 39 protein [Streptomyces sp. ME19-01-6]
MLSGLLSHGYHLFRYPLYLTDEGIYMQRAWSLVRETRLSPYTYDYDHAPAGWITLAGWAFPLPKQFEAFGNAINTGRFLMLLVHLASVVLLFEVTRRLSGSVLAATIAAFFFNLSPIAVYYQRQVLLDNLMMFWVLLALYALLRRETTIRSAFGGGIALGIALITKENALFFAPTFMYLLYRRIQGSAGRRFTRTLWPFAAAAPIGAYITYALLKNELLPSGLDFDLANPPADHVSLLYTLWWQINRSQGSLLSHHGLLYTSWLPRDAFLLLAGMAATGISLWWGMRKHRRDLGFFVAGTLAFGYAFYLLRGSVVLDFYITPLIPMFAMNIGMVTDRLLRRPVLRRLLGRMSSKVRIAVPALLGVLLLAAPSTGYVLTVNTEGRVAVADQYQSKLALTHMQQAQIAWVRKHVSPKARIIMDDDMWGELHDVHPFYPYAHSHWNASSDPALRDKLFRKRWQNVDYIIMSNKMRNSIHRNNGDGRENWILAALRNSERVWADVRGGIRLEIYRVNK